MILMMSLMLITKSDNRSMYWADEGVLVFLQDTLLYSVGPQHLLSVAEASNGAGKNRR
jgi:hypothetical protein